MNRLEYFKWILIKDLNINMGLFFVAEFKTSFIIKFHDAGQFSIDWGLYSTPLVSMLNKWPPGQ